MKESMCLVGEHIIMKKVSVIATISALAFGLGFGISHSEMIKQGSIEVASKMKSSGVLGYGKW